MSRVLDQLKKLKRLNKSQIHSPEALATSEELRGPRNGNPLLDLLWQHKKIIKAVAMAAVFGISVSTMMQKVLFKATETEALVPPSPYDIQMENNDRALRFYQQGQFQQARDVWQKLSKLYPQNKEVRVNLAMSFKKLKQNKQAIEELQRLIQLDPQYGVAYNNLALLAAEEGNFLLAQNSLEAAISHAPNLVEPLFNLASLYERIGSFQQSILYYKKFVTHPNAEQQMVQTVKKRLPRLHSIAVLMANKKEGGGR
ncbi:MAG: tetratricopeptide repeat protein [Bdellovibrionales bacterium]|nr:tetratricopeptide repeat protein [Bdellovibrionales bacterium]